ncbi:MAG: GntR family transcriptional regulator [Oceanospirillaceae bacterium]|nr:GntR family transcriptional regulator [Oceanospirillaceae bacterium]
MQLTNSKDTQGPPGLTAQSHHSIADLLADKQLTSKDSLVAQVSSLLWDLITKIELRPGQMISEKEVAEALNISKTPIREALIRLEDAGLVRIVPKSGTYVTPINIERYLEACFTRVQLESGAVRQAAKTGSKSAAALEMTDVMAKQKIAFDTKAYADFFILDERLHQLFYEAAGLAGVWKTVKRSQADLDRIRHLKSMHKISRRAQVLEEHQAIVDAIQSAQPDAAEQALTNHIGTLDNEIQVLSRHPGLLLYIEALNSVQPKGKVARKAR